ncbi:MAG TPA: L-serine ammonia-lyase [Terracidiphilus sp.]|jgi:L-serine dehydratase
MISLFEIFKIGIGPSSSHTVGPMLAAKRFARDLEARSELGRVSRVCVELHGSLAHTGKGHGTDRAVMLGLCGEEPHIVNPITSGVVLRKIRETGTLEVLGEHAIAFSESDDIIFHLEKQLPLHTNGMRFTSYKADGEIAWADNFYSIGGGFILGENEPAAPAAVTPVPHEFHNGDELLRLGKQRELPIWRVVLENECAMRPESEVVSSIDRIWQTMNDCMERGMTAIGTLPGHLNVRRRAEQMASRLRTNLPSDPLAALDWVSVYAIAVNEENAAGGRVVTAPTNGAAGIIPAVARYYRDFIPGADREGVHRFLLTAAAIGILYKKNASISGAEVGCQGEVGVAASMAAGGLVAAQGGTNAQVEHAAEMAMEHHLGMTCDPVGGLVQIPCIERNAMGAVKAINASRIAMNEPDGHKVSLDQVIETMYRTGLDMQSRYKETSLAGLALNIIEC